MNQSTSDQIMNYIATGNQMFMDWYTLTHSNNPQQAAAQIPRYVPPQLVPGVAIGTTAQISPLLIVGAVVLVAIVLMK